MLVLALVLTLVLIVRCCCCCCCCGFRIFSPSAKLVAIVLSLDRLACCFRWVFAVLVVLLLLLLLPFHELVKTKQGTFFADRVPEVLYLPQTMRRHFAALVAVVHHALAKNTKHKNFSG